MVSFNFSDADGFFFFFFLFSLICSEGILEAGDHTSENSFSFFYGWKQWSNDIMHIQQYYDKCWHSKHWPLRYQKSFRILQVNCLNYLFSLFVFVIVWWCVFHLEVEQWDSGNVRSVFLCISHIFGLKLWIWCKQGMEENIKFEFIIILAIILF